MKREWIVWIYLLIRTLDVKPWEAREEENPEFYKFAKTKMQELKNMKVERPERERTSFVSNDGQSRLE